jgi:hypothetical protein
MDNRNSSARGCPMATFFSHSPEALRALRKKGPIIVMCLFAMIVAAGCASTKITGQQELVTGKVPRPGQIWVYDFAATAADIPANSALAGKVSEGGTSQSAAHIAEGRKLGAEIAADLIKRIHDMGMPAAHGVKGTTPAINDLVIRGYILSFKEGSEAERVGIGFGEGASELKAAAEGFQMTANGLRKLGGGTTAAGGSKAPGSALGLAGLIATHNPLGLIVGTGVKLHDEKTGSATVEGRAEAIAKEIADVLKKRFQEQGWIQ